MKNAFHFLAVCHIASIDAAFLKGSRKDGGTILNYYWKFYNDSRIIIAIVA